MRDVRDSVANENMKRIGGAAFRAGWAAACLTIADQCDRFGGGKDLSDVFRRMANDPPPVEIGDTSTPEGKAMAAQPREVVMLETFPRSGGGNTSKGE